MRHIITLLAILGGLVIGSLNMILGGIVIILFCVFFTVKNFKAGRKVPGIIGIIIIILLLLLTSLKFFSAFDFVDTRISTKSIIETCQLLQKKKAQPGDGERQPIYEVHMEPIDDDWSITDECQEDGFARWLSNGDSHVGINGAGFILGTYDDSTTINDIWSLEEYTHKIPTPEQTGWDGSQTTILDYGETILDGQPAYWIQLKTSIKEDSNREENLEVITLLYEMIYKNVHYKILLLNSPNEYSTVEQKFKKSLETFTLKRAVRVH